MKLIVGLGNPGTKYEHTRHNAGFMLVEELAKEWGIQFQEKPKFKAAVAEHEVGDEKVLLIKPLTFYNLTGETIRAIRDFYKCDNSDTLIIHDDMALPFGTIRTRLSGGDAGNNGVRSLNQHLGTNYARIRIGTWSDHREKTDATGFVLGKLDTRHRTVLAQATRTTIKPWIEEFASTGKLAAHTVILNKATDEETEAGA